MSTVAGRVLAATFGLLLSWGTTGPAIRLERVAFQAQTASPRIVRPSPASTVETSAFAFALAAVESYESWNAAEESQREFATADPTTSSSLAYSTSQLTRLRVAIAKANQAASTVEPFASSPDDAIRAAAITLRRGYTQLSGAYTGILGLAERLVRPGALSRSDLAIEMSKYQALIQESEDVISTGSDSVTEALVDRKRLDADKEARHLRITTSERTRLIDHLHFVGEDPKDDSELANWPVSGVIGLVLRQ